MLARPRPILSQRAPFGQDGIFDLPAGKIAAVATYMDMRLASAPPDVATPAGARFEPIGGDLARYRRVYGAVGQTWLWFSRAVMPDRDLESILVDPAVEALAFVVEGRDVGMVEVDFRKPDDCELAFLGLLAEFTGRKWGDVLAAEAIRRARARGVGRLWLHTCTLDHPGAVRFYTRIGFRPYRRAIEIASDPRLAGDLPRDAAPQFPPV